MVPDHSAPEPELRDYLRVLRRRKVPIIVATILVVGAAIAASLMQTKVYRAETQVLVERDTSAAPFDSSTGAPLDPDRELQNEVSFAKSRTVTDAVTQALGYEPDVSVSTVEESDLIILRAFDEDPERAATAANTYARTYLDQRRNRAVADYQETQQVFRGQLSTLQAEKAEAQAVGAADRVEALDSQIANLRGQLGNVQLATKLVSGAGGQIISEAEAPSTPVRPAPRRNALVALVVGLVLGVGLAFLFEHLDDSVTAKEDLERATGGLTVLALIPAVSGWRDRRETRLVSITDPTSPPAEAYRSLRTSIQFAGLDRSLRTIQVTSPRASEGKTTTIANLGVALARAGQRVILVCCDLRRPRIHEFFGVPNDVGFTSVLLGEVPLSAAVQPLRMQERLALLASGPTPPNPSELLSSRRTAEVLAALADQADVVIIDCPPVLPVTDSLVLSAAVDATLLVASSGGTTRKEAQRTVELLRQVDAPVVGCVLNGVTAQTGYGYGYGYGYESDAPTARRDKEQEPVLPEEKPAKRSPRRKEPAKR